MNHRHIPALAFTMLAMASGSGVHGQNVEYVDMLPTSQKSFYWDAKELQRVLEFSTRAARPAFTPSDSIDAHAGMSYVMGIADVLQGTSSCPTPVDRAGSATFEAVEQYIAVHPDRLSESAAIVAKDALQEAFPCQVKAAPH